MNLLETNKLGIIEVSEKALKDFWKNNKWFVPLQIEPTEKYQIFKYLCYSEAFEELVEGACIPYYDIEFERKDEQIILTKCEMRV